MHEQLFYDQQITKLTLSKYLTRKEYNCITVNITRITNTTHSANVIKIMSLNLRI